MASATDTVMPIVKLSSSSSVILVKSPSNGSSKPVIRSYNFRGFFNPIIRTKAAPPTIKLLLRVNCFCGEVSYDLNHGCANHACKMRDLRRKGHFCTAEKLFIERKSRGSAAKKSGLVTLVMHVDRDDLIPLSEGRLDEIFKSSLMPKIEVVSELIDVYGSIGRIDIIMNILDQICTRDPKLSLDCCKFALAYFGNRGQLDLMESVLKKMVSLGLSVDSPTANAFVVYYSIHGSLTEMEVAYARLKRSRILIEEEAIRAISFAYIREQKYYSLGRFLRDVGLARRNVGNLLWNLSLLSYAANFKMKSLQREFLRMVENGFRPDITTFNIRALAFSKMSLFWDLHVTLEHMKHEGVAPDLVTYGCIVDAYLERRLTRNLDFALSKLQIEDSVSVSTDPLVFEVMGKGDFHSSSESFMEFSRKSKWMYKELISLYIKKMFRNNQVFWNY